MKNAQKIVKDWSGRIKIESLKAIMDAINRN
jgi:hypothetical protein